MIGRKVLNSSSGAVGDTGASWRGLALCVCLASVISPNVCWFLIQMGHGDNEASVRALQGAAGYVLIILSLLKKWPCFASVLAGGAAIFGPVAFFYVWYFSVPVDINALSLVAETGSAEARDLISSLPFWLVAMEILAFLAALCAIIWPWRPGSGWPSLALAALGFGVVLIMLLVLFEPDDREGGSGVLDVAPSLARDAFVSSYPIGLPLLLYDYRISRQAIASAISRRQGHFFGVERMTAESGRRRIHIFVIGETASGKRWQLNGYPRQTNPHLSVREDVISFAQMTTPFVFTRLSVPAMLTRAGTRDVTLFNENSVVSAFKEAGFRTAWISMQAPLGFHESLVSSYAAEADFVRFLNPVDYSAHGLPDMHGVDAVLDYIAEQPVDADLFIVLHILGSHFRYTDRYPPQEAYFLPDEPSGRRASLYAHRDALYLSNAYDNSLRYTDSVLNSLFDRIGELKASSWVYFSADHGEAVFDGCDHSSGHGQYNAQTQSVAAAFWSSPEYSISNPERISLLRRNSQAGLSTIMVFETITALGGINVPGRRDGYDFSSRDQLANLPSYVYAECESKL